MTERFTFEIRHNQILEWDGQAYDGWMIFVRDEKGILIDTMEGTYSDEPSHFINDWKKENA